MFSVFLVELRRGNSSGRRSDGRLGGAVAGICKARFGVGYACQVKGHDQFGNDNVDGRERFDATAPLKGLTA